MCNYVPELWFRPRGAVWVKSVFKFSNSIRREKFSWELCVLPQPSENTGDVKDMTKKEPILHNSGLN